MAYECSDFPKTRETKFVWLTPVIIYACNLIEMIEAIENQLHNTHNVYTYDDRECFRLK